jgi:NhaP-type Na+/H+ or K+/H+ antiporter
MWKNQLQILAIVAFVFAFVFTGVGGWSDMMGSELRITKQHAWNDGIFLMLGAIFLLLLSRA